MGSPQFWARPYRIPVSSDPDTATAQTVEVMCDHITKGAMDTGVQMAARRAVEQFAGLSDVGLGAGSMGSAAFWWCKTYLQFRHHEFIIRERIGEAGHLQGLISPEVIVNQVMNGERPEGDCAIYTDCVASFLRAAGVPYEIVTVAVNPEEPDVYSHVFLYEVLPNGERLALDASHGDYPGWQVPTAHVSRRQVWDANGNPVADRGSRFVGLGAYGLRADHLPDVSMLPAAASHGRRLGWHLPGEFPTFPGRGMGADGDFGGEYTGTPVSTDPYLEPGGYSVDLGPGYFGSSSPGDFVAPTQNSAQWASFATNLAKMGFTLAQINAIQPGTVVSANGAILRQNPGYSVPVTGASAISANLGGASNILLIGGGLLALVLVMSMGKR
jgi:hypothetical protein